MLSSGPKSIIADSHKQQQRERLRCFDTYFKQPLYDTCGVFVADNARQRQVNKDCAEAHGKKQGRLKILLNGQPDQQAANHPHRKHFGILHNVHYPVGQEA